MGRFAVVLALWPLAAAGAAQAPQVVAAEPLMDLKAAVPSVTPANFRLQLDLPGFLTDRGGKPIKLTAKVARVDGAWQTGTGQGYRTPRPSHAIDGSGLTLAGRRLTGTLKVDVRPDPKRHREAGTATCTLDARLTDVAPDSLWPKDDIDIRTWPYYFIYPQSQGAVWEVRGTYEGAVGERRLGGKVTGFIAPPIRPGHWNMGAWDAGLRLDFNLGSRRRNWNHGRLAIHQFPKARDLSAHAGIRLVVATDRPRADVEVTAYLREDDGSWYHVKAAVPLADRANEAVVLFEDFVGAAIVGPTWSSDEDYALDLTAVSHVALGLVDPFGLGKVSFTVKALDLVKVPPRPVPAARVTVSGKTLSVNGHDVVPVGLFGGYWDLPQEFRPGCMRHFSGGPTIPPKGHTEKFHIDVWHDRYQTALPLTDPNWKSKMAKRARDYARKAKEANVQAHLEIWNEPYLNWTRSLKNFHNRLFDETQAKEGGPVTVKATGKTVPHFQWTKEGDHWRVIDATQHTYYSTRGNAALYDDMLFTVAKAAKEANPDVQIIVSWGFRWKADHWAGWELEYKPTIDRCIDYIDGACEHHYGADPTALVGMYEVLAAYGKTRHNKWLYSYNTEAGNLSKVAAHGRIDTPEKAATLTQLRKAVYELRDILCCAAHAPDKLRSRTILTWHSQARQATPVAYGFLKNLRGRLVEAETTDQRVWCVASIDGTDPDAMPKLKGHHLVVALFNDHAQPRAVELTIVAPTGTTFRGGAVTRLRVDPATYEFGLATRLLDASGASHALELTLPERSAWKVVFPLAVPKRKAIAAREVRRHQFFSPDILRHVARGKPFATKIALDPDTLKAARRAWLRLVVEDVAPGEATLRVGTRAIVLPKAYTSENINRILRLPIAPADLAPDTQLDFRVNPGNFAGYRIDMASIVLEMRSE